MKQTTVVNQYRIGRVPKGSPEHAYIGRKSPFGNPYIIGMHGNRQQVIAKYRAYFERRMREHPGFRQQVEGLRGKTLICFCAPLPCHGDVIAAWLDRQGPATAPVVAKPRPAGPDDSVAL